MEELMLAKMHTAWTELNVFNNYPRHEPIRTLRSSSATEELDFVVRAPEPTAPALTPLIRKKSFLKLFRYLPAEHQRRTRIDCFSSIIPSTPETLSSNCYSSEGQSHLSQLFAISGNHHFCSRNITAACETLKRCRQRYSREIQLLSTQMKLRHVKLQF